MESVRSTTADTERMALTCVLLDLDGVVRHFDPDHVTSVELRHGLAVELGVEPESVLFTDDSASKLGGAVEIGMTAHLFEGVETFRRHLAEADLKTA